MASTSGSIRRATNSYSVEAHRAKTNTTTNNFDIPDLIDWLRVADRGDPTRQARISMEILEKDWDIAQAYATRIEAVAGIDWDILPPKDIPTGQEALASDITQFVRETLRGICPHPESGYTGMEGFYKNAGSALLSGYSISQIRWADQLGSDIDGFEFFPQDLFIFKDKNSKQSRWPLLMTSTNTGQSTADITTRKLSRNNWVVHQHLPRSGDMTRGGMIRPLAYLYLLKLYNIKNWARFAERHGTPFITFEADFDEFMQRSDQNNTEAQTADEDYKLDFDDLKDLAENFANDGAAILPKDMVKMTFHEAMNSDGLVFEKFEQVLKTKVNQMILGQDSTSSSENANRSIGGIHYQVKHEILVRDCKAISDTVMQQIIAPLVFFNFGSTDLIPRHKFAYEPPKDLNEIATWISTMSSAGYEVEDIEEVNKKFGVRFKRQDNDMDEGGE